MPLETRNKFRKPEATRTAGDPQKPGRAADVDVLGIEPAAIREALVPDVDREPPGFMPTQGMVEAKATLWKILAHDPSLLPERLSREQVTLLLGDKRLKNWYLKSPGFHAWLMNRHEHAALAEALYDRWIRMAFTRLPDMSDKDFNQIGKLLAEVAGKMPERWMKEKVLDGDVAKMDDARLVEMLLATAKSLGWEVRVPEGTPGAGTLGATTLPPVLDQDLPPVPPEP